MSDIVTEFAPAKINLALHVTGRRDDGYHLLDSLVAFADVGDVVSASKAAELSLSLSGPAAAALEEGDSDAENNLVLRAARLMAAGRGARLTLEKRLPVASGIGGGSADAAATLRLLARLWGVAEPEAAATLSLGADVPVCLRAQTCRMQGVGERLQPVSMPVFDAVLVNPGCAVSTPDVFRQLVYRENAPLATLPEGNALAQWFAWLAQQRNDLEAPATALVPEIGDVLGALWRASGCQLARMSGSGATCFGLFSSADAARQAAMAMSAMHPGWWITSARLGDQTTRETT